MTGQLPPGWTVTPPPAGANAPAVLPEGWTVAPPGPRTLMDDARDVGRYAVDTAKNIPGSALEFGKSLIHPIAHPQETAESLGRLYLGLIQKGRNAMLGDRERSDWSDLAFPMPKQLFDETAIDAVGKHFAERYGGKDEILKAIKTDPVGVMADISTVLTGGGMAAAKLPGMAGKVGQAVETAGRVADPVNAVVKTAAKVAEPVVSNAIGMTSGAGAAPLREGAAAGMEGGPRQAALISQMRRNDPIGNVVEAARNAIDEMRVQRGDAYRTGMAGVAKDPAILDFAPIDAAIQKIAAVGTYDGKLINPKAAGVWEDIAKAVDEWKAADPTKNHTVEGFDALKKRIGAIRDNTAFDDPARVVADRVYHAVKDQIVAQAPAYGQVMKGYEEASSALQDLEKSLSLGEKASIDTAARKLQSIMRNNANTNYGRRVESGRRLEDAGANTLMPMIAGQALSSPTPRGLSGAAATVGGLTALLTNPWALAALPLTSPRLMGEGALKLGQAGRLATSPLVRALASPVGTQAGRTMLFNAGRIPGDQP